MGGTFNDEMMAENERSRGRVAPSQAGPAPTRAAFQSGPGETAATPSAVQDRAPHRPAGGAVDPGLSRTGRRVMALMIVIAAVAVGWPVIAGVVGALFASTDGSEAVVSSGPVGADVDGRPVVSWETGGFAFDTPETWSVDAGFEPGVVQVWTDDGDLIELLEVDRWNGIGEADEHAFGAALQVYDERIGADGDISGFTFESPYADTAVEIGGATAEAAVLIGPDGSSWAAMYHRDSGDLDRAWWEVLLTSVRPA